MSHTLPFGEVLEAADVQEARQDFAEGRCSPATPDELMREILK